MEPAHSLRKATATATTSAYLYLGPGPGISSNFIFKLPWSLRLKIKKGNCTFRGTVQYRMRRTVLQRNTWS
jgi:hypothetical protein